MKPFAEVVAESTCLKRVTVCEIYSKDDRLLARESNRCAPDHGVCSRIGVVQDKSNYALVSCNWTHAEVMACNALPEDTEPFLAIVYGHYFPCDPCEATLRARGVQEIVVVSDDERVGLR